MNTTKARKEFKAKFGQANHFLITTLVGLDAIENNSIKEKGASFSTSWNPRDQILSAKRSRIFVLKSFLGTAVETLEMYLTKLNHKPKLLQDHENDTFLKIYSSAGQSIYRKAIGIGDEIKVNPILIGLIEILITWRNYTLHYGIDNKIREDSWNTLLANTEKIKDDFNGLDIVQLKQTYENNTDFSFKETASLISATQKFVEEIDSYVLSKLDQKLYIKETLEKYFENDKFFQRFKSSANKKDYLEKITEKLLGLKDSNFFNESFIEEMKNHRKKTAEKR
jgi:hypothetical protein